MTRFERYYKYFPLISCILLVITFLAPVAGRSIFGTYVYIWIWGLVVSGVSFPYNYSDTSFVNTTMDSALPLIISVICSVILLAIALKLIKLYKDIKNGIIDERSLKNNGIKTIITMIIYIIIMDISYNIYLNEYMIEIGYPYPYSYVNFWNATGIGFGLILPFISGGLAITGTYMIKYYSRIDDRSVKTPTDMYIPPIPAKKDIMTKSTVDLEPETNFCPECGTRILKEGKFCPHCGIKFLKN